MRRNGFTLIQLMIFVAVVGVFAVAVVGRLGSVSNGTRTGMVVKLSSKGYVFKTNEGQLMLGGAVSGQAWDFTIPKGQAAFMELLESAQKSQKVVTLTYRQAAFTLPWLGDTSYFITKVD